jgi:hypothetical protein
MSIELSRQIHDLLTDCSRMAAIVGLQADVDAAKSALNGVETAEDLYNIYRTDVPPGAMSIRNLLAFLDSRLKELHTSSGHCRNLIELLNNSAHVHSLHTLMAAGKKGSTDVSLYHPSSSAKDLDKALTDFQKAMGENLKPRVNVALKRGKGRRCGSLLKICLPICANTKKTYSGAQMEAAKALAHAIKNV